MRSERLLTAEAMLPSSRGKMRCTKGKAERKALTARCMLKEGSSAGAPPTRARPGGGACAETPDIAVLRGDRLTAADAHRQRRTDGAWTGRRRSRLDDSGLDDSGPSGSGLGVLGSAVPGPRGLDRLSQHPRVRSWSSFCPYYTRQSPYIADFALYGNYFCIIGGGYCPTLTFGVLYCFFHNLWQNGVPCSSSYINPGPQMRGTGAPSSCHGLESFLDSDFCQFIFRKSTKIR